MWHHAIMAGGKPEMRREKKKKNCVMYFPVCLCTRDHVKLVKIIIFPCGVI